MVLTLVSRRQNLSNASAAPADVSRCPKTGADSEVVARGVNGGAWGRGAKVERRMRESSAVGRCEDRSAKGNKLATYTSCQHCQPSMSAHKDVDDSVAGLTDISRCYTLTLCMRYRLTGGVTNTGLKPILFVAARAFQSGRVKNILTLPDFSAIRKRSV